MSLSINPVLDFLKVMQANYKHRSLRQRPDSVLGTFCESSHFLFVENPRTLSYPCFTGEQAEVSQGQTACPKGLWERWQSRASNPCLSLSLPLGPGCSQMATLWLCPPRSEKEGFCHYFPSYNKGTNPFTGGPTPTSSSKPNHSQSPHLQTLTLRGRTSTFELCWGGTFQSVAPPAHHRPVDHTSWQAWEGFRLPGGARAAWPGPGRGLQPVEAQLPPCLVRVRREGCLLAPPPA